MTPPDTLEARRRLVLRTAWTILAFMALLLVSTRLARTFGVGVSSTPTSIITIGLNPMTGSGWLGLVACLLVAGPSLFELEVVLIAGVALETILFFNRPFTWDLGTRLTAMGVGLGAGAGLGLLALALRGGPKRATYAGLLALGLFLPIFPQTSEWGHQAIIERTPLVYDGYAMQIDGLPGVPLCLAIQVFVSQHEWLRGPLWLTYQELPLIMLCALLVGYRTGRYYNLVQVGYIVLGALGMLGYLIYPAMGVNSSLNAWGGIPPAELFPGDPRLPRNCMPSLHMSWALAAVWGSWAGLNRLGRLFGAGFLVATLFATVVCAEHYLIDCVAAFPFVLAVQGLTSLRSGRWRLTAVVTGFSLYFGYLFTLRFAHAALVSAPALTVAAEVGMVGLSLWLERRLRLEQLGPATGLAVDGATEQPGQG